MATHSGQNYGNHRRWNPLHHFVNYGLLLVLVVLTFVFFYQDKISLETGLLFGVACITIGLALLMSRSMALKAQDRAIRVEESFRHFVLTGKPLSAGLRLGQIVALRFASDAEMPELAKRAEAENLKGDDIKRAIKNWRGDYHRV